MDAEKVVVQPPPAYKQPVSKTPYVAAVVIATMCATALLVVSVLGGIYVTDLKQRLSETGPTSSPVTEEDVGEGKFDKSVNIDIDIDNEGTSVSETVNLDKARNEEVDLQYDHHGQLTHVSVMDLSTRIYGIYSVAKQQCYLYHAGQQMYDTVEDIIEQEEFEHHVHQNATRLDFYMDEKPIQDHSILPDNLKPYCKDKATHWMRPADTCGADEHSHDHDHERRKRATFHCVGGVWVYTGWCYGCGCPGAPYCGLWYYYDCVGGYIVVHPHK